MGRNVFWPPPPKMSHSFIQSCCWTTLQVSHRQGWKNCVKMYGKTNFSRRLKQWWLDLSTSYGWEGKGRYGSFRLRMNLPVGVQVKLWNPLKTENCEIPRAIPERFCSGDSLRRGAISSVCTFDLNDPELPSRILRQIYSAVRKFVINEWRPVKWNWTAAAVVTLQHMTVLLVSI